jgi:hypothetical protein
MGHALIGNTPQTRAWKGVTRLLSDGADEAKVAAILIPFLPMESSLILILNGIRDAMRPALPLALPLLASFHAWPSHRFFAAALKFLKEPRTSKEVRNLAFAHLAPEEFPTHRMLQELMMLDPMGAERDQIMEIATLLLPWCRDGNYGCLFDGTSNLSLTGKIAHFELGYIPESAKD